jgi:hypothetical protein
MSIVVFTGSHCLIYTSPSIVADLWLESLLPQANRPPREAGIASPLESFANRLQPSPKISFSTRAALSAWSAIVNRKNTHSPTRKEAAPENRSAHSAPMESVKMDCARELECAPAKDENRFSFPRKSNRFPPGSLRPSLTRSASEAFPSRSVWFDSLGFTWIQPSFPVGFSRDCAAAGPWTFPKASSPVSAETPAPGTEAAGTGQEAGAGAFRASQPRRGPPPSFRSPASPATAGCWSRRVGSKRRVPVSGLATILPTPSLHPPPLPGTRHLL